MTIQAVLFDAVGTLIYPDPPVAATYQQVGRQFGSSLDLDEIARRTRRAMRRWQAGIVNDDPHGRPKTSPPLQADADLVRPPTSHQRERQRWQDVVAEVFDDVEKPRGALFEALWRHFAAAENWRVYRDVPEAWRQLGQFGVQVGIASNFDDRLLSVCGGLEPLAGCRHIFWSADIGYPKPSLQFFRRVERRLQLAAEEILIVGDDWVNDCLGGRAAGWRTVFLDRSGTAADADAIRSLLPVPNLLAKPA